MITSKNTLFLMVDIQEKFRNVIPEMDKIIKNSSILNKFAEMQNIPIFVTEQYPEGLGKTLEDIYVPSHAKPFIKTRFSIFDDKIDRFIHRKTNVVIYGIEAHICITQTALDAKKKGFDVYVIADAVSSRTMENKDIAINRLRQEGCIISSTEMFIFEMIQDANIPQFKDISKLVK